MIKKQVHIQLNSENFDEVCNEKRYKAFSKYICEKCAKFRDTQMAVGAQDIY